jgi:hypothetical protein
VTKSTAPAEGSGVAKPALIITSAALAIVIVGVIALHAVPGVTTPLELKILGIAFAVGLDVLALSIAVGIMQLPRR